MRKSEMFVIAIILLSFVIGIYQYPSMPDKMASHWNAEGEVNGYMPKFMGLFLMPALSFGLFLLFIAIPKIDPLKENIKKFRKYYDGFVALIIVFLFYIYLLTIFWNAGARFNMTWFMLPALGLLFYYVGILTENAKQNWFVGIRTPWTLSNEKVWNRTNRLGGRLFKAAGIIALFSVFFGNYAIWLVILPVFIFSFYLILYSYFEYQKEK